MKYANVKISEFKYSFFKGSLAENGVGIYNTLISSELVRDLSYGEFDS